MYNKYDIDYELFSTMEVIKIIEFFNLIESTTTKHYNPDFLVKKYREYQNIINNKSLEKKYDKMLYEHCKISIYEVMKSYIN